MTRRREPSTADPCPSPAGIVSDPRPIVAAASDPPSTDASGAELPPADAIAPDPLLADTTAPVSPPRDATAGLAPADAAVPVSPPADTASPDLSPASAAVQLPLRLVLSAGRRFENFETPPGNAELVDAVRRVATGETPTRVLVVGDAGAGKTHLLEAACAAASAGGNEVAFAPMRHWRSQRVDAVRGLGRAGLVCIDDIDAIAGVRAWEEALFVLFEESAARHARLLLSAVAPPSHAGFVLPDLRSRLGSATLYRLRELDDEGRARALRRHARGRGVEIPDDVLGYVLSRHRRDMHSLIALLDLLDHHSMAQQRRLTVPFVRDLIEAGWKQQ